MRISLQKQFALILNDKFSNCLNLANITPVFKKGPHTLKNNYRPVSILPIFLKLFERLLSRQLSEFFDNILSKFQCGFRKGYGNQYCFLLMLEIWKEATDNNKTFGALLTDHSKAFDCLSHDLLIAKLHAYGIDIDSLNILQDYLSNRKHQQKWILFIVLGKHYSPGYLKALYLDHFCSIYLCVTCS